MNSTGRPVPRLLVISPVKDEAQYIERTIRSVVAQEVRPTRWIIVDDGSSDRTGEIADAAAREYPWIEVVHRKGSAVRRVGPGVVEAFYDGLSCANLSNFDFVCKLDGDIEFQPGYFAEIFRRFAANPKLGTASGKAYLPIGDHFVLERSSDDFSHGIAKLYRRQCFEEIGGFVREVMWDGIDCHRCRMLGWEATSFGDPELAILHLRQMGSSFKSIYHGRVRWGRGQYFMGTHLIYLAGIVIYRMFERPWIIGGLCIFYGYFMSWLRGARQYDEPGFRSFLHHWQMTELVRRVFGRRQSGARVIIPASQTLSHFDHPSIIVGSVDR